MHPKLDAPRFARHRPRGLRPMLSCKELLERCCRCFRGPASKESALQAQLAADKAAMVSRHKLAEQFETVAPGNAVVRFGKAAGRKTEYALFVCKEYALNSPGCASGRSGFETVKAKTVDGVDKAKAQTKKVLP